MVSDALGFYRVDLKDEAVAVFKDRIEHLDKTRSMYQRQYWYSHGWNPLVTSEKEDQLRAT